MVSRWLHRTRPIASRGPVAALDDIDCALLAILQERGDVPNVELARAVGLSPAATLRRVRRLREDGVIEGVRAAVDPGAVGLVIDAFVLATLAEHSARRDAAFARALGDLPNVLRADSVAGADDVLLHVVTADAAELHRVLLELKRAGAQRVRTMLRLQTLKPPSPVPVRPAT
jgi:Lrp/AsnC family transcriptional regulator, leucine-responsive regulatory protein